MLIVYFITYASTFNPFWGVSDSQNKQLNSSNWKKGRSQKKRKKEKRQDQERKQLNLSVK